MNYFDLNTLNYDRSEFAPGGFREPSDFSEHSLEDGLVSELTRAAIPDDLFHERDLGLQVILKNYVVVNTNSFFQKAVKELLWNEDDREELHRILVEIGSSPLTEFQQEAVSSAKPSKLEDKSSSCSKSSGFVATEALMLAWLEGYNSQNELNTKERLSEKAVLHNSEYFREIERSIDKIISNFARLKSYDQERYRVTFGGQLLPNLESLLADDLYMPPRSAVAFLDILTSEIYKQSQEEPVFTGNWGELVIDGDGELSLHLSKRRSKSISSVLKR